MGRHLPVASGLPMYYYARDPPIPADVPWSCARFMILYHRWVGRCQLYILLCRSIAVRRHSTRNMYTQRRNRKPDDDELYS